MRKVDLSSVDLNLLVALEILLQEQHITKSAERLNMSQPAMSRTLARLQKLFDDPLMVRTSGGYSKTPRAQELEPRVAQALRAVELALTKPEFDPLEEAGVFKISSRDYGEVVFIPTLMRLLSQSAPNLKIEIVRAPVYSITEVEDGRVDLSLGIMPNEPTMNCVVEPLFDDRFVCVMSKYHPAANGILTLESYLSFGHSLVESDSRPEVRIDKMLQPNGSKRTVVKWSPYFLSSLFSLSETELIQLSVRRIVEPMLAPLNLVIKELPFKTEPARYCMTWHLRNIENPLHKWVREQILMAAKIVSKN